MQLMLVHLLLKIHKGILLGTFEEGGSGAKENILSGALELSASGYAVFKM